MDELATADIDPDVSYFAASFEEYQVAEFEVFLRYIFADLCEKFRRPWYRFGEYIPISNLYESRAIYASFAVATKPVGSTLPATEMLNQSFLAPGLFGSFWIQSAVFRNVSRGGSMTFNT